MFLLYVALSTTLPTLLLSSTVLHIFREIDANEDNTISLTELGAWFNFQDVEYLKQNARDHFIMFDKNHDNAVTWEEYANIAFGANHVETCRAVYDNKTPPEFSKLGTQVQDAIMTAVRRWRAAGGFSMSQEEFTGFTYPELFQHMRNIVVAEAYQTYDTNRDGKVSGEELLGKKFKLTSSQVEEFRRGEFDMRGEPNMLGLKDRNNNGVFEKKELSYWLMENRRMMRRQESEGLFREMDTDGNSRISLKEFRSNSSKIRWSSIGRFIDIKEEL